MTTRQRIQRQQRNQELLDLTKDTVGGLLMGAGLVLIFYLS